jgi:sugar lactone lactonase YvrE
MKVAKAPLVSVFLLSIFLLAAFPDGPTIITAVGDGKLGFSGDGGPAAAARIFNAHGIAFDSSGNLYIADTDNQRIRKVSVSGIITTVAGNGIEGFRGDGGPATAAGLGNPWGVALDPLGNLYIADSSNCRVRKVDASGIITTVAGKGTHGYSGDGGPATSAELGYTRDVAVDSAGNIYIVDEDYDRVRKVDASGIIITVAGKGTHGFSGDGGPATSAELKAPCGVAVDSTGNIYIDDENNARIRKVDASGVITTVAGGGSNGLGEGGLATSAEISDPVGLTLDSRGNFYFADSNNGLIRKVSGAGIITTVAGNGDYGYNGDDIPALSAKLSTLSDVAVDSSGNVYLVDEENQRIREVRF